MFFNTFPSFENLLLQQFLANPGIMSRQFVKNPSICLLLGFQRFNLQNFYIKMINILLKLKSGKTPSHQICQTFGSFLTLCLLLLRSHKNLLHLGFQLLDRLTLLVNCLPQVFDLVRLVVDDVLKVLNCILVFLPEWTRVWFNVT